MHSSRRWDALRWALLALAVLAHIAFALLDTRLPSDGALVVRELGPWLDSLRGSRPPPDLLMRSGAWYTVGMAATLHLTELSPAALRLYCSAFGVLLLLQGGRLARELHGPEGGALATGLLLAMPMLTGLSRIPWFHIPEAALVVGMAVSLLRDPLLERWQSWAVLIPCGLMVASLRTTGPFWLLTLAPLLWPALRERRWRVLLLPLLWLPGAWVQLAVVAEYLEGKVAQRSRYALQVPALFDQLDLGVGRIPLILSVGLIGWGGPWRHRRPESLLLLLWLGLPLLLVAVFRAGVDNHPLVCVGLAGLAASAAKRRPWVAAVPASWAALWLALSWGLPGQVKARLPIWRVDPPSQDLMAPWTGFGGPQVEELLAAACPHPGRCEVWVTGGLAHPRDHSTGSLEGLLLGRHLSIHPNLPPPNGRGPWILRTQARAPNPMPASQLRRYRKVLTLEDGSDQVELWMP